VATRTIANAGGTWSSAGTWVEGVVPTAADDVVATATSGNLTIDNGAVCQSADFTNYTAAATLATNAGWSIGGTSSGGLKLVAGMTWTANSGSTITFVGGSGATYVLTSAGKTFVNVTQNTNTTTTVQCADAFTATRAVTSTQGSFATNNQSMSTGQLNTSGAATRAVNLGSSSVTVTGTSTAISFTATVGFTFTAGTSTVTLTAGSLGSSGSAYTFWDIVLTGANGGFNGLSTSGLTCRNLTKTGTASKTESMPVPAATTITVTGTLTITGNSTVNRVQVFSGTVGTSATLNAAAVSLTNVDFADMAGAGAAAPFTGTSLGDATGNSGITFTAAVSRFGVVAGNWSDTATWSATSGGAGGASVPLPQDTVVLDASSAAGTYTADMPRLGKDITCTGFTRTLSFASVATTLYGNFTLGSGMTISGTFALTFSGRGSQTVTTAGKTWPMTTQFSAPGGSYTLQDAWTDAVQTLTVANGTFAANGFAVTTGALASNNAFTRAISMGSGAWSAIRTVAGNVWNTTTTTGLTLTVSTAVFSATGAPGSAATVTVTTGAVTMPNWTVNGGANLTCQFSDAFTTAGTITLTQAKLDTNNQTVSASVLVLSGSSTRTITLGSSAITLTASSSNAWSAATITGLTVTANTATATLSATTPTVASGAINWNGLSLVFTGAGTAQVSGAAGSTFANITRTGTAAKTDSLAFFANLTITGTFTVTGNSITNRVLVQSSTLGTARTITVNTTVTVSNADFQDITGAGTASWNLSAATGGSGDALGNSGITFTTAASQFWRGNGGSWSDVTHWASTSGGAASSGRVPLPQDTAVFDANSFSTTAQGITMDMPRGGANLTTTGVTNTPSFNSGSINVTLYGNITLTSGVTRGSWSNQWIASGRSSLTLTTGGLSIPALNVLAPGGTYTMQDAYSASTQSLNLNQGTFNANGFTVSVVALSSGSGLTRTVTMGSGAWSITGTTGNIWSTGSTGLTLSITNSQLNFTGTSGSAGITTGGTTLGPITFNGAGGSWTLNDSLTMGTSSPLTLTAGTFNTNGQSVTSALFTTTGASTKVLNLGGSSVTLTQAGTSLAAWDTSATASSFTLNAGTSTITMTGAGAIWRPQAHTFNNVVFTATPISGGGGISTVGAAATYANFTVTGQANKTGVFNFGLGITVTGTLTLTGNSTTNRFLVQNPTPGATRTLTAAAVSITNVDFMDITGAGAAAPFTGTSLGDATGNSGITFDAPTTQTHTASAGGNWSDVTKWTSRVPLPQDSVVIDVNTTGTLTADMPRLGKDLTFTGFLGTAAFSSTSNSVFGSVTLASGMTVSGTQSFSFLGRGTHTITSAGKSFTSNFLALSGPGGTYTQQDAFSHTGTGNNAISDGTWDANGQAYTGPAVNSNSGRTRTVNLGSGTWTLTGSGTVWSFATAAMTLTAGTSTIALTASNASRTFIGGSLTYATLRYDVASPSQGALVITGANTFANMIVGDGRTLTLPSGSTTTVTSSLSLSGTAYVGYLYLGGQSGQYVSTPDQAALRITGDIDVRVRVALDDWTPTADQSLIGKYNTTTNQRAWRLVVQTLVPTGSLKFDVSTDGSNAVSAISSALPVVADGATLWVRATWRQSDGRVQFFTASGALASPAAADFTQLGVDRTAAVASLFPSSSTLDVGASSAGTLNPAAGQFYKAEVRNGIDGTVVSTFDASLFADPYRYYSPTGNLLDKDSSDLEGSIGGWSAGNGAPTVTRDATASAEGSASLKIVSTAAGSTVVGISGLTFNAATAIPVAPGTVLSFLASVKGVAANLTVSWYDASGSSISSPTALTFGAAGAFTDVAGTLTAPATAMWAVPKFNWTAAGAGEVLNADKIAFQVGTAAAGSWSVGGVPWRVNGYTNNPGVPFGRTALNASTAGTAATIATGTGATVTVTSVKDITATPSNTVYALDSSNVANNTGIVFSPADRLPVTRRPRTLLQAVARAGSW
jgi:collagen type VII alpha